MAGDGERKKIVCLGMPGYHGLTGAASLAFWHADRARRFDLRQQIETGSLLAHNFNRLWCWALNTARTEPVAYFAMQHSDIQPAPGWLGVLVDELERAGLDVLGVPAPIKDNRGITSTALDRDDGDTWRVHCRLSVAETLALPETFTSGDVGRPLLLNTGLWVCRFDPAWAKTVHFEINDRIVQAPDGNYYPQVVPEDWNFSRMLHECGLKIGCTRKVVLSHHGSQDFPSDRPWGAVPFDREYLSEPPAFPATQRA